MCGADERASNKDCWMLHASRRHAHNLTRLAAAAFSVSLSTAAAAAAAMPRGTFFEQRAATLAGDAFEFAQLRGRVTMITNVASR